ncbi:MAG: S-methyl-5-thioribose-1-phosphate isomerase [Syntrophaceae bacterium]|nr:S-methyl-5-thioribose-1-phosphate isomerase [Syntrophaceae bacterium]
MRVKDKQYRTIWMDKTIIRLINQMLLPHKFEIVDVKKLQELKLAINNMTIRGAGAIGAAGAFGIAQAAMLSNDKDFFDNLTDAATQLRKTRPTAQNLFTGIDFVLNALKKESKVSLARETAVRRANLYADMDASACKKIGEFGAGLIKDNAKVSTHCNAGWLAFVDWGSALSPVYYAVKEQNKNLFVYVDETRPRCQGANLTAWELVNENIPHLIIADNVTGALMYQKKIDIVFVGADRIARNGDIANKIGTYSSAVVAHDNNIPFYVAAPVSTIDANCPSGDNIPIEERDENEILYVQGKDDAGAISRVRISPEGSHALNIGFDVTPAKYITGIITEMGIYPASYDGVTQILSKVKKV